MMVMQTWATIRYVEVQGKPIRKLRGSLRLEDAPGAHSGLTQVQVSR